MEGFDQLAGNRAKLTEKQMEENQHTRKPMVRGNESGKLEIKAR